jgi:hypothetical protein
MTAYESQQQINTNPYQPPEPVRRTTAQKIGSTIAVLAAGAVSLVGGIVTLFLFAAADAASRGAGFIGCGDGVPDPQGAMKTRVTGTVIAAFTVIIVVVLIKAAATRPKKPTLQIR